MALSDELIQNAAAEETRLDAVAVADLVNQLSTPIDTVDESMLAAEEANRRAEKQAARMQSRYGTQLTPVERQQQARLSQQGGALNISGAGNLARRRDFQSNLSRLGTLSDIFSAERRGVFGSLGVSAGLSAARRTAYESARAGAKRQQYGLLGNIGANVGRYLGSFFFGS
tara:strand:+ start:68 stop:580 length:513 start_codon:yes stop_codon:yes gene_type:complete